MSYKCFTWSLFSSQGTLFSTIYPPTAPILKTSESTQSTTSNIFPSTIDRSASRSSTKVDKCSIDYWKSTTLSFIFKFVPLSASDTAANSNKYMIMWEMWFYIYMDHKLWPSIPPSMVWWCRQDRRKELFTGDKFRCLRRKILSWGLWPIDNGFFTR